MVSPVETHNQDFTTRAIRQAAQETGADFDFLLQTAARESNFDVMAEARTSSAAGMFQFIEQTWLGVMHRRGAEHGYQDAAAAITQDANGRYSVADPEQRERILDMRFDAVTASRMAGELAAENAGVIEARVGRSASSGELYAAHFLGAGGAASLIAAAESAPDERADRMFPAAARANRPIFYEGGRPRSTSEVLARLTGDHPVASPSRRAVPQPAAEAVTGAMTRIATTTWTASPAPARNTMSSLGARNQIGNGELSPALVEILASLDAPRSGRSRKA